MDAADFTLIRDLDVLKDVFTMKLRVIRLFYKFMAATDITLFYVFVS